jgi:hypothetical protein
MKMAIVRPTQPYLKKTLHFLSHRIEAQKQLTSQLFPNSSESSSDDTLLFDDAASVEEICDSDGNDGNESSDEDSDEFEYEDSDTDKFSYKWR